MAFDDLVKQLSSGSRILADHESLEFQKHSKRWSDLKYQVPSAIALSKTDEDVKTLIQYANLKKIPFVTKSGGMSLYSTIGENGIVIDLSGMRDIRHDKDAKVATLYGGVLCKDVAMELAKDGFCTTLPSANPIGAIPFFLNGGNSMLAGRLGLGSDLILGARIVTAEGEVVDVREGDELLYALRGAGQYFGIVTRLEVRTFAFEEALGNAAGKIWAGRFVFPLERAREVCEVMKGIVNDMRFEHGGLIMIGAPPPAFKPAVVVLPKLLGEHPAEMEKEAFRPLYELGPIVSGGAELPVQNAADALDPMCAPGGYKRLVLTGLYELDIELFLEAMQLWQEMVAGHPDSMGSYFSFQWDTRFPKKPGFESASSSPGIRFWANTMTLSKSPASETLVQGYLDQVVAVFRKKQKQDDYVDFSNSLRGGPIERRYVGTERRQKLQDLKQKWDPKGRFSRELL